VTCGDTIAGEPRGVLQGFAGELAGDAAAMR